MTTAASPAKASPDSRTPPDPAENREGIRRMANAIRALAMDAVEAAILVLEDCPLFNAGRGAALTRQGVAEMDASVMEGRTLRAGAVGAGVTFKRAPKHQPAVPETESMF